MNEDSTKYVLLDACIGDGKMMYSSNDQLNRSGQPKDGYIIVNGDASISFRGKWRNSEDVPILHASCHNLGSDE